MSALAYPGDGPRCRCGCPYLSGIVLLPLVLTAADGVISIAGPSVLDRPVESLNCEACGRTTITRDLPPVGIDVIAVLGELAERPGPPLPRVDEPRCTCGAQTLTWSTVVTLTVHAAGATMLGEVSSAPASSPTGTLRCAGCARSWNVARSGLPPQLDGAITAFTAAMSRGDLRCGD